MSVRHGSTPYFYMLTPAFTVLFAQGRVDESATTDPTATKSPSQQLVATVTPTTAGLRKDMHDNGVVFETVNATRRRSTEDNSRPSLTHSVSCVEPKPTTDTTTTPSKRPYGAIDDDDHASWLEAMGASPSMSKRLRRMFVVVANAFGVRCSASHTDASRHSVDLADLAANDHQGGFATCVVRGARNVQALYTWV